MMVCAAAGEVRGAAVRCSVRGPGALAQPGTPRLAPYRGGLPTLRRKNGAFESLGLEISKIGPKISNPALQVHKFDL